LQNGESLKAAVPYAPPAKSAILGLALVPVILIPLAAICVSSMGAMVSALLFGVFGIAAWVVQLVLLKPKAGQGLLLTDQRAIMILDKKTLEAKES
jgi:ABC-type transport system involved in cytochrome c biogenesis permease subunit